MKKAPSLIFSRPTALSCEEKVFFSSDSPSSPVCVKRIRPAFLPLPAGTFVSSPLFLSCTSLQHTRHQPSRGNIFLHSLAFILPPFSPPTIVLPSSFGEKSPAGGGMRKRGKRSFLPSFLLSSLLIRSQGKYDGGGAKKKELFCYTYEDETAAFGGPIPR